MDSSAAGECMLKIPRQHSLKNKVVAKFPRSCTNVRNYGNLRSQSMFYSKIPDLSATGESDQNKNRNIRNLFENAPLIFFGGMLFDF